VVDPHDLKGLEAVLREEMARPGVSVVITRRPCVMIRKPVSRAVAVLDPALCIGCRRCMSLGCPAISFRDGNPVINSLLCYPECRLCADVCPKGALSKDYSREAVDAD
jgi:indolepyruvate ferredoxin oxidoreductase alpha subunit